MHVKYEIEIPQSNLVYGLETILSTDGQRTDRGTDGGMDKTNPIYQLEQLERLRFEIPPVTLWLPILLIHIESQVKPRQSQSYKFEKLAKNFEILQKSSHATHLLKLLNKLCKYEMDPASIVDVTERTRFCPQTDGQMDRRTDRRT